MQSKSPRIGMFTRTQGFQTINKIHNQLTPDRSHCIGSLDSDRLVEKNQVAKSLTVGLVHLYSALMKLAFLEFIQKLTRSCSQTKLLFFLDLNT